MLEESDENIEGWRNFSPTKNVPDILSPGQNFYLIFLSPTEIFTQNFILKPKIKSKIFTPWSTEISALNFELHKIFFRDSEGN